MSFSPGQILLIYTEVESMFFFRVALLTFTNIHIPFDRVIGEIGQTNERREERETETGWGETEEERQTDRQVQRLYFAF